MNLAHTSNKQRSGLAGAPGLWEGTRRDEQGGALREWILLVVAIVGAGAALLQAFNVF